MCQWSPPEDPGRRTVWPPLWIIVATVAATKASFLELQLVRLNCFDLFLLPVSLLTPTSPFEHEHTMKRRLEDQEIVYAPQQQQPRRPQIQGVTDNLQLSLPTPAVVEAAADNMQPSTGIQYSLPQGYQVCKLLVVPGHWNTESWFKPSCHECHRKLDIWRRLCHRRRRKHFKVVVLQRLSFLKKGPTLFQGSTGHGHNPAHIGPHGHNLAVQAQGPAVVQGHVHPPAVQGQQQFQRLKVRLHGNLQKQPCSLWIAQHVDFIKFM